jgi:hypothetical protein
MEAFSRPLVIDFGYRMKDKEVLMETVDLTVKNPTEQQHRVAVAGFEAAEIRRKYDGQIGIRYELVSVCWAPENVDGMREYARDVFSHWYDAYFDIETEAWKLKEKVRRDLLGHMGLGLE